MVAAHGRTFPSPEKKLRACGGSAAAPGEHRQKRTRLNPQLPGARCRRKAMVFFSLSENKHRNILKTHPFIQTTKSKDTFHSADH